MIIKDGYYYWNKGDKEQLSPSFNASEFSCQCKHSDCIEQKADVVLIEKLQALRDYLKSPVRITSAFRCSKHQKDLAGSGIETAKGISQHELGRAVDLKCSNVTIPDLVTKAEKLFNAIGVASSWIHVDLRGPEKRRWSYTLKA